VLIAEAPGAFRLRVAVEQAVDAARWCPTDTIADADVLMVVGSPGPDLRAVIDHTWTQMSEPRAKVEIRRADDVESAFTTARASLTNGTEQPHTTPPAHDIASAHEGEGSEHDGHDHDSMSPDGISLAEGAGDRDGLEMDELHVPLGPVLTHWPAGLVLHLTLNGDVVTHATAEQLGSSGRDQCQDTAPERAGRLLDSAASLLSLAGLPAESARARWLRDRCLTDSSVDPRDVDDLVARVRRQRLLRWLWRKMTVTDPDGDVRGLHDQFVGLVERASGLLRDDDAPEPVGWPSPEALAELVRGQELAAVRLWVAALSADLQVSAEGATS
jgi:hypothetical protein